MRIGIAQIRSTDDPWENLLAVQSFYMEAASKNLELLCFPENVFFRGPRSGGQYSRSQTHISVIHGSNNSVEIIRDSAWANEIADFFLEIKLPLSLGSVLEQPAEQSKPSNSHWIVYPGGKIISYQKIHLFDFSSPTAQYRESDDVESGSKVVSTLIENIPTGLSICFDLRFSELYRELTLIHKTQLLLIPAAFTSETGERHWHALLKARAIENLSFVAAAGQWGSHKNLHGKDLFCYGNSVIYDPWGEIIALAPESGDSLLIAELDFDRLKNFRKNLPALDAAKLHLNFDSSPVNS